MEPVLRSNNRSGKTRQQATQFKPGRSGNPGGRPRKGVDWEEAIREHSSKKVGFDELLDRLYREDLRTYCAYAFGKPVETHEVNVQQTVNGVPEEMLEKMRQLYRITASQPKG